MTSTIFAAIPWTDRTHILMKDITQPGMSDNSVYGWPKTQMPDGVNFYPMGGFAFSEEPEINILAQPPMTL
jgi:hypothetical protein